MSNPDRLDAIVIEPPGTASATVIWLHGLGADGHDFEPLVPELGLSERGVRFILPHAPMQPVTVNGGYVMRAWYDIRYPDLRRAADEAGIRASVAAVGELIAAERAAGIPSERILLAGFSQGGAIILHAGLTHPEPLAGLMPLSTYLALPEQMVEEIHTANRPTPIFMAHGTDDPIAPFTLAEDSRSRLTALGCQVEFHRYDMGHSVCQQEIADIRTWLHSRL